MPTDTYLLKHNVDIPVPGGGGDSQILKVFTLDGSPASSSLSPASSDDDADEPGEGFFRTFPRPQKKKCAGHSALGVATWCGLQLIRAERSSKGVPESPRTRAHLMSALRWWMRGCGLSRCMASTG